MPNTKIQRISFTCKDDVDIKGNLTVTGSITDDSSFEFFSGSKGNWYLEATEQSASVTIPAGCTLAFASVNVGSTGSVPQTVFISGSTTLVITMDVANEDTAITGSYLVL